MGFLFATDLRLRLTDLVLVQVSQALLGFQLLHSAESQSCVNIWRLKHLCPSKGSLALPLQCGPLETVDHLSSLATCLSLDS